jgi:hypothetical protein
MLQWDKKSRAPRQSGMSLPEVGQRYGLGANRTPEICYKTDRGVRMAPAGLRAVSSPGQSDHRFDPACAPIGLALGSGIHRVDP